MQIKSVYLPGLNGIRAIAAIGVLLNHINLSLLSFDIKSVSLFGIKDGKPLGYALGEQGVTMFFVLSGFLITYLLLFEKKKFFTIDIKKFYFRRILRIWPLYYFYLGICFLGSVLVNNSLPDFRIVSLYVLLLANIPFFLGNGLFYSSHLWSIAVEEQFYLFWPWINKYIKNLKRVLIIVPGMFIVIRILLWIYFPYKPFTVLFTINRFDCMMIGGLFAFIVIEKKMILKLISSLPLQIISWLIFLIVH